MSYDQNCIFCKIVSGDGAADFVYKDERVVAFRDIHPIASTHLLVIPRIHIPSLNEADDPSLLGHMLDVGRKLAKEHGVDQSGYRTLFNCQSDGGQVVYHLHLHVIGGRKLGPMG